MVPVLVFLLLVSLILSPVSADELWLSPAFGPSYVSDTIPDTLLPGHTYPVFITFRNTGLVSWHDDMRRIGLLYEGDMTKVTAIPSFVEISPDMNITPGKHVTFGLTLVPVGLPGEYTLSFSVVLRSATSTQKITEVFEKKVMIVPTDGISSPVNGSLFIDSSIVDLDVYLNSALKGNTPAIIPDLKPGQYMVQVKNDSFDQIYSVDVEKGTMTRLYITEETSAPLITRKKAGPISDGTLMGYIEANIPFIAIVLTLLLICAGTAVYAVRRRNRTLEQEKKEKNKKSDDPDVKRSEREKELLDKIHQKKPFFEAISPSAASSSGSRRPGAGLLQKKGQDGYYGMRRSQEGTGGGERSEHDQDGLSSSGTPPHIQDVKVRFYDLTTRPGSATARVQVSNQSPFSVSVHDQMIDAGGFGIVPLELSEPTSDDPSVTVSLKLFSEGVDFFKEVVIPYNRGIALLARGVIEKAYEYFRGLLFTDPENVDVLWNQAKILLGWGLEEEAAVLLHKILGIDPDHGEACAALAEITHKAEKKKNAKQGDTKPSVPGYPEELSGRYTPIRVLGDDPFAKVILVRKNDTGELRALKIPYMVEKVGSSLLTEISLLYQLRHPYVLRMYRAEFSPVVMLELEYVSGGWFKGERYVRLLDLPVPLPFDQWFVLIQNIAQGLAYLHRQGVRHYHISPKYILLDEPFTPKISGLIRESLRSAGGSGDEEFFVRAPEQIDPHFFGKPGKKTDIFQLGALWLWMVTGKVMGADGFDPSDFSFTHINGIHDASLEPYVPLFKKLTARFKKDRYASVEEFLDDLMKVTSEKYGGDDWFSSGETQ